ncbi:MAG: hypothetical protein CMN04_03800 [Roseibacillus sp.]|nr:hypothetical protein [Roseibacillus sp.]
MSEKNVVLDLLEELSQNRLLSSEVETMISPYKGKIISLNFRFKSAAKSFGSQKDIVYNEGYSLTCTAGNSEIEVILLFSKADNDLAESFEEGHVFEESVKFIDYDTLYRKAIFGKVDFESHISVDENEIPSSSKIISSSIKEKPVSTKRELQDESEVDQSETEIESSVNELKQVEYSYKLAEPHDYGLDESGIKFEDEPSVDLSASEKGFGYGCMCMFVSIFFIMGSAIAFFDGMNSAPFLKFGLALMAIGFATVIISKLMGAFSGNN